jgi:hypothetical protein
MSSTPEGKVKDKIKTMLKSYGPEIYYFMPAMGTFGKAGIPDIVCCIKGWFIGIEVKADKHKNPPTELQKKNLREIQLAGGLSFVVDAEDLDVLNARLDDIIGVKE